LARCGEVESSWPDSRYIQPIHMTSAFVVMYAPEPIENPQKVARQESSSNERIQALSKAAELHDKGILTDAEFESEKRRILNQ
jgi:hypothetical protein